MLRKFVLTLTLSFLTISTSFAQETQRPSDAFGQLYAHQNPPDLTVVSEAQWRAIDQSVNRGLNYLASKQQANGSLVTFDNAEPAVTALYAMAAISAGHEPGVGPHGESINRAVDYILACQCSDGLISRPHVTLTNNHETKPGKIASYNHGICGTLLGEVYGMSDLKRAKRIKGAIEDAVSYIRAIQGRPLQNRRDRGGWRYIRGEDPGDPESDLSVTSWQIMFLRSAHNAGFDVPKVYVDDAIEYVRRCYLPETGEFLYVNHSEKKRTTRGMTGAGVLCLFLTGNYDNAIESKTGAWLLRQSFTRYNTARNHDRYFYGAYYCSQAAFQLGGDYWAKTYPPLADTLVTNQRQDGSWHPDHYDKEFGSTYSTSIAILTLTPPYQLLPIYQR